MSPNPARPIITLEEHFLSEVAAADPSEHLAQFGQRPGLMDNFTDLGPRRLADMDAGHVTMQVISHGPGDLDAARCRACNDQLAAAVAAHRGRFAGFAELPMVDPEGAAAELRRTCGGGIVVTTSSGGGGGSSTTANDDKKEIVKFVGALVDCHTEGGRHYDGPEYDVLWRAAVELDVPIYIHPTFPSQAVWQAHSNPPRQDDNNTSSSSSSSGIPDSVQGDILAFGFGWHSDVAMHVLRLYAAGLFDRFPALQVVIGHMGEMLPYMLQRVERVSARWRGGGGRSFREVWDANLWVTTSGNWALDPMACMLRNTRRERILYSVDYPFARSEDGLRWLRELEDSGMVSADELEGIRWKNAARLLKLDIKALEA